LAGDRGVGDAMAGVEPEEGRLVMERLQLMGFMISAAWLYLIIYTIVLLRRAIGLLTEIRDELLKRV
jgi:hypothetical protein